MVRSVEAFEAALRALADDPKTMLGASVAYAVGIAISSAIPAGALFAIPFLTGGVYGVIYNKTLGGTSHPQEAFQQTGEEYYARLLLAYILQAVAVVLIVGPAAVLLSLIGNPTGVLSLVILITFGLTGVVFYIITQFAPVLIVREDIRAVEAYRRTISHSKEAFGSVVLYTAIRFSVPFALLTIAAALFSQGLLITTIAGVGIACLGLLILPIFNALYHTAYYEAVRQS